MGRLECKTPHGGQAGVNIGGLPVAGADAWQLPDAAGFDEIGHGSGAQRPARGHFNSGFGLIDVGLHRRLDLDLDLFLDGSNLGFYGCCFFACSGLDFFGCGDCGNDDGFTGEGVWRNSGPKAQAGESAGCQ